MNLDAQDITTLRELIRVERQDKQQEGGMEPTESLLIDTCQELGRIAECNCHFTAYLARLIDNGDEGLLNMKIGDFLSWTREATERFNRVHSA